ncbi:alpha/beta hydrolase [Mesorhizobium sp. VK4C]|uniref:alpha/beta fold hydrolase n=1 Tax=Mesorhizobium captivum TaxID=3072319 RepID=UPI002A23A789|nr:alpha/beta hydrolase [Mesorhizobium sp. VK4C]MDX8500637.1 alpha/beta hydrolase [Mesorhizobium sp. VK4C]
MTSSPVITFAVCGSRVAARIAGDPASPALLLIHGFPSSSKTFRYLMRDLSAIFRVIAPDLPGFGASEVVDNPTFAGFADVIEDLLDQLDVPSFYLYLHDYGAAVGLHLATRRPERIRGLIIQNANAHRSGLGDQWSDTERFWSDPGPDTEAKATAHLTFEGTRDQYVGGIPGEIAERMDEDRWLEDWQIMSLPGRLQLQRALVLDYGRHVARFDQIARYLRESQPPALMVWGRHDIFFDLDETLSWMNALPRMEAHILDGGHFLLETNADQVASLMKQFICRTEDARR